MSEPAKISQELHTFIEAICKQFNQQISSSKLLYSRTLFRLAGLPAACSVIEETHDPTATRSLWLRLTSLRVRLLLATELTSCVLEEIHNIVGV